MWPRVGCSGRARQRAQARPGARGTNGRPAVPCSRRALLTPDARGGRHGSQVVRVAVAETRGGPGGGSSACPGGRLRLSPRVPPTGHVCVGVFPRESQSIPHTMPMTPAESHQIFPFLLRLSEDCHRPIALPLSLWCSADSSNEPDCSPRPVVSGHGSVSKDQQHNQTNECLYLHMQCVESQNPKSKPPPKTISGESR